MGIGERSTEQGVVKHKPIIIDVVDAGERLDVGDAAAIVGSVLVGKGEVPSERVCRIEPGTPVCLVLSGDPDEVDSVNVIAEPNIRLGPLRHPLARRVAILLRMGVVYGGEVVGVVAHATHCEFFVRLSRYVCREEHDAEQLHSTKPFA
jgi:hypothetical protein